MRELRIAYLGTGLSGRSTSMQQVHRQLRGVTPLQVHPIELGSSWLQFSLVSTSLRLTVIGVAGATADSTVRDRIATVAHAVVMVLDSQVERMEANKEILERFMPHVRNRSVVVQLNKRDLANASPMDDIRQVIGDWARLCTFETVATRGTNVLEAFECAALLAGRGEGIESDVRDLLGACAR